MKQILTRKEYDLYKKAIREGGDKTDVINFVEAVGQEKLIDAIRYGVEIKPEIEAKVGDIFEIHNRYAVVARLYECYYSGIKIQFNSFSNDENLKMFSDHVSIDRIKGKSMYKKIEWTEKLRLDYFLKFFKLDSIAKIPSSSVITFINDGEYSACTVGDLTLAEIGEIITSGRLVNYYSFEQGINLFGRDVG